MCCHLVSGCVCPHGSSCHGLSLLAGCHMMAVFLSWIVHMGVQWTWQYQSLCPDWSVSSWTHLLSLPVLLACMTRGVIIPVTIMSLMLGCVVVIQLVVVCVHMDHIAMDCHSWLAAISSNTSLVAMATCTERTVSYVCTLGDKLLCTCM